MDKIFLNNLQIETIIGIYDWERHTPQTLTFDLEMDWDISPAANSDDIAHALDYSEVAQRIVRHLKQHDCLLIERLAEEVCSILLADFAIPRIKLTLSKPVAIHGQNTARIVIERSLK